MKGVTHYVLALEEMAPKIDMHGIKETNGRTKPPSELSSYNFQRVEAG
jgi:hypothetical protein